MIKKPAAGIVVLNHAETHILCVFPTGQYGGLLYTIPKGKLDEGEDFLECAEREFHEETGIPPNLLDVKKAIFRVLNGETSINVYYLAKFKKMDSEARIHQFCAPCNKELGFPESYKNEWIPIKFVAMWSNSRKDRRLARSIHHLLNRHPSDGSFPLKACQGQS